MSKSNYHLMRTPGQLLSLTSHLSFNSPFSRGQSPVLNSPEMMRNRHYSADDSFFGLNEEIPSIGISPARHSPEVSFNMRPVVKRKHAECADDDNMENIFKIPRTGLSDIFNMASFTEETDERLVGHCLYEPLIHDSCLGAQCQSSRNRRATAHLQPIQRVYPAGPLPKHPRCNYVSPVLQPFRSTSVRKRKLHFELLA